MAEGLLVAQRQRRKKEFPASPPCPRRSVEVTGQRGRGRKADRHRAASDAFRNCAPWRTATPATPPESTIEKGKHVGPQNRAQVTLCSRTLTPTTATTTVATPRLYALIVPREVRLSDAAAALTDPGTYCRNTYRAYR